MKKTIMLFVSLLISSSIFAGPFGVEMGMTLNQIRINSPVVKKKSTGFFLLYSLPKYHSYFKFYTVKISPTTGLCYINAYSHDISTNADGVKAKYEFYEMYKKLEKKYGKNKITDELLPYSKLEKSNDWLLALSKNERLLFSRWDNRSGKKLNSNLSSVTIGLSSSGNKVATINIYYYFLNGYNCEQELAALEDEVL